MATQLSIVNRVQRRLRDTITASVGTSAYSALLGEFLNDIIQQVSQNYDWRQLESDVSITVSSGTSAYDLTGTTGRSTIRRDHCDVPMVWRFDDGSDATGARLAMLNSDEMYRRQQENTDSTSDDPYYFSLRAQDDAAPLEITLWPEPSATRTIKARVWTPPADLAVDGTDDATVIYLPEYVLYLGTLWLALDERGEEVGEPGGKAHERYLNALGEAEFTDSLNRQLTNEYESYRD